MIPFSVLDLAPIPEGADATQAFRQMRDLAKHADAWGYHRYWLAEHHGMPGIASAATAVLIGHVAGATERIRVGSGGIMLPNHAPLMVAEQFGTLESLYPGRIDLGLGRAPGTDPLTARALRRHLEGADAFPEDVEELQSYFRPATAETRVRAVPGTGLDVPLWLLGSSLYSAELAARRGLPFAFASHFAPAAMTHAIRLYRDRFEPSDQLDAPYVMLAMNVVAADSDAEAERLFTTLQQQFVNLRRGRLGKVPPPVDDMDTFWLPHEQAAVNQALAVSAVGAPDTVKAKIRAFVSEHAPDELMLTAQVHDHAARLKSFEIAARVRDELAEEGSGAA